MGADVHAEAAEPSLTWDHVVTLALAVHRGLSYRQIAQRLGRSERETARLIRDALSRVGRLLDDQPGRTATPPR